MVAINFQSACAKKEELFCLIDAAKPDVIIGSETWSKPTFAIFKSFHLAIMFTEKIELVGMDVCFLGISTSLNSNKIEIEKEGEFVATNVLSSKHAIILAAAY